MANHPRTSQSTLFSSSLKGVLAFWMLLIPCAVLPSGCIGSAWGVKAEETRTLNVTRVEGEALQVKTANGKVTVGVDPSRADVEITAHVRASASSMEKALARLEQITVVADHAEGNVLDVFVDYGPDGRRGNDGCSFEISLPSVDGVTIRSSNGSITLSDTAGPADLQTSNGRITVKRHDGTLSADSSNGSLVLEHITGQVKGDTSNGSITYTASDGVSEPFVLDTSNGSITITIPSTVGGVIRATTSNGSVKYTGSEFVREVQGSKKKRTIYLQNEGGDSIADTSNGSIRITIKEGEG